MKLLSLTAKNYGCVRSANVALRDLTLFIGANASGKSTILDALRFLRDAVLTRDFRGPVTERGGIPNLAWKGQPADQTELTVALLDDDQRFEWTVQLAARDYDFSVTENVWAIPTGSTRTLLMMARDGKGWWIGQKGQKVQLQQWPSACALVAASADANFPGRQIAEFVSLWAFFDPIPYMIRDWSQPNIGWLNPQGVNLGATLYALKGSHPEAFRSVVDATRSVVGLPTDIEPMLFGDKFYFWQHEPGLHLPVSQANASSGTLRMLALMTALYGHPGITLIGIEEPENYIHPTALFNFVQHIVGAEGRIQMLITTHSPLLLDYLDDPAAVNVVKRHETRGTMVIPEPNPEGVRKGLERSGFSLGQHHETKGFGG